MKKVNKDIQKCKNFFKKAEKDVKKAFSKPPPPPPSPAKLLKQMQRSSRRTNKQIAEAVRLTNEALIKAMNDVLLNVSVSLNKDVVTGKPIRPYLDDWEYPIAELVTIVEKEESEKDVIDNFWVSLL